MPHSKRLFYMCHAECRTNMSAIQWCIPEPSSLWLQPMETVWTMDKQVETAKTPFQRGFDLQPLGDGMESINGAGINIWADGTFLYPVRIGWRTGLQYLRLWVMGACRRTQSCACLMQGSLSGAVVRLLSVSLPADWLPGPLPPPTTSQVRSSAE